jgi:hypothetical protein
MSTMRNSKVSGDGKSPLVGPYLGLYISMRTIGIRSYTVVPYEAFNGVSHPALM